MRILDRYILRSFLYATVMWFVVLMALRIVVDLFVNMDEFVRMGEPFLNTVQTIATYYAYHSVEYFAELGGIIIVVSAAFTLAMMNHTNELTAMMASGVSLYRVAWPIIVCSLVLSWLVILDRELLMPRLADKLVREKDEINSFKGGQVRMMTDGAGTVWFAPEFSASDSVMRMPILTLRDSRLKCPGWITAGSARPGRLDGRHGWYFEPMDEAAEIKKAEDVEAKRLLAAAKTAGGANRPSTSPALAEKVKAEIHLQVIRSRPTLFRNLANRPTLDMGTTLAAGTEPMDPKLQRSAWERNPDITSILSDYGPDEIVKAEEQTIRKAGKDPYKREFVLTLDPYGMPLAFGVYPAQRDFVLSLDMGITDPFYGLTIHGTLNTNGTLAEPRYTFTSEEGRELCTFTAASAKWNDSRAGETCWELTGGRLFYPSDLETKEIVLRLSGQWVDYLSTAQLTELLHLERLNDKKSASLIRHVRVTEPINNLIMLLLALPFILSRERNLKASVGLCLLITLSFLAFIYICRYAQFPVEWTALSAWMPILLFGPVSAIMMDSVKT